MTAKNRSAQALGRLRMRKGDPAQLAEMRRRGGKAAAVANRTRNPDYYRDLGRQGAAKRWSKTPAGQA